MIADLVDHVVQPLERLANLLPSQLCGLVCGRIQAEPHMEQAADDPIQQPPDVLCLLCESAADQVDEIVLPPFVRGVPDHGQDHRRSTAGGAESLGGSDPSCSSAATAASTEGYTGTSRPRPCAASSRRTAGAEATSRSSAWRIAACW